jgi:hypothetical protein
VSSKLADDLLHGAGQIAEEVHGSNTKKNRRKIYHAHEKRYLPIWNEGGELISRRSLLEKHYNPPALTKGSE